MTLEFFLPSKERRNYIYLRVKNSSQKSNNTFRTPLKISPENWDEKKQRPTNIYKKKYKLLNNKLDSIKIYFAENLNKKDAEAKTYCHRTLAREITKICSDKKTDLPKTSFLFYMQQYINCRKELICNSTYKRYKVFYHLLERYEGYVLKRLYIDTINSDFINDFIRFGKEEEYSENTIYRTIHFVKTVLNFAERKGIRTAVRELELRRERQFKEMVTLTEQEIIKIKTMFVPEKLQAAKDWLLISCYTGQRFSDFMNFKTNKIQKIDGKDCLSFKQQKTQKQITLPLHPTVIDTIEKNGNAFPKTMDMQHYDDDIKKIAQLASLNELVKARKRIGYRTKDVYTEKWEILTSHIGRRSFATIFFGKIPTPLLMAATGHSSEQIFMRYINPVDNERILSLGNYFDKMYEETLIAG